MKGICRLCERESDLQESHIIPKFIYAHLKVTSPTGKIREAENPNLRKQDGIKLYWLCIDCEAKFSEWEKYFSEKIYRPLQAGENPINYDHQFLKFCVSISWRVSKYVMESGHISHFSAEIINKINNAIEVWKRFILDQADNPDIYEQHFYNFTGKIEQSTLPMSTNIHRYLQRTVAVDVINWGPHAIIIYAKFPGLMLVGFVHIENRGDFRSTRVHVNSGQLNRQNLTFSDKLWKYIQTKADVAKAAKQSISDKQKGKIDNDYNKLASDVIATSGTFQSLQNDIDLFGIENIFPNNTENNSDE